MTIKEVCGKYGLTADTLRYYERIGVIPTVSRSAGGMRDYREEDLSWVENAVCMRGAGVPVESIAEYVRLYCEGDTTLTARRVLLQEVREELNRQKEALEAAIDRLEYKISRYEIAEQTGELTWDE